MKKTVIWSGNSQSQLLSIDRETAMRILHAIDDYVTDGSGDVKRLRPPRTTSGSAWATTAGPHMIEILSIRHRSQAY